ncbi:MAG: sugar-transfer associated ATP-grasp domain-containing protein, partial [Anaerotardibacter sp.]
RIGTSSTIPVDNASMGGLVACINLETGELSEARSLHNLDVHEVHPDSGNPIKGVVVPEWERIKETALNLAKRFPYIVFVAWDILLGEDGKAYIIEANASSGVNIIQLWGPQKQGELGDFYRAHGVLKK